ncbi:hypothetical protein WT63_16550 [Burkholderia anthina]|nr:hypothetical protein WT63_16550 [Burkholderia anthina]
MLHVLPPSFSEEAGFAVSIAVELTIGDAEAPRGLHDADGDRQFAERGQFRADVVPFQDSWRCTLLVVRKQRCQRMDFE